jgi:hypothetical protein
MRGSRRTRFSNARLGSRRLRLKAPTTPACQPGVTRQAAGLLPSAPLRSDWANISQIPVWSQCTSRRQTVKLDIASGGMAKVGF